MRCSRTGAAGLQDRPKEKMVSFVMTLQHAPPSSANNLLASSRFVLNSPEYVLTRISSVYSVN
jgi:hypothetical protein